MSALSLLLCVRGLLLFMSLTRRRRTKAIRPSAISRDKNMEMRMSLVLAINQSYVIVRAHVLVRNNVRPSSRLFNLRRAIEAIHLHTF